MLTAERLISLVHYEPETGVFTWLTKRRSAKPGDVAGHNASKGYRKLGVDGRSYPEHRLAWLYMTGKWPIYFIDHINGIRDDNRFSNLRDVTASVNGRNLQKAMRTSSSGVLGVVNYGGRWLARVGDGRKKKYLGYYGSAEEAHAVYLKAREELEPRRNDGTA